MRPANVLCNALAASLLYLSLEYIVCLLVLTCCDIAYLLSELCIFFLSACGQRNRKVYLVVVCLYLLLFYICGKGDFLIGVLTEN